MRKFYTLLAAVVTTAAFAQEVTPLNINGSLEDWSDVSEQPSGWFISASNLTNNIVAKETGNAQDGEVFLSIQNRTQATGNNNAGLQDVAVTPGSQYNVSYWYRSESETFNFKHWIQWRTVVGGGANIEENLVTFQPENSNEASVSEWNYVSVTETAPATANGIRVNFRNYVSSSVAYIDNVIVSLVDPASVNENTIEGLSIYPNPANDLVNIGSAVAGTKNVTIFDLVGKKVLATSTEQTINVSGLEAGVYIINIEQNGKTASRKLVIK